MPPLPGPQARADVYSQEPLIAWLRSQARLQRLNCSQPGQAVSARHFAQPARVAAGLSNHDDWLRWPLATWTSALWIDCAATTNSGGRRSTPRPATYSLTPTSS